MSRTKIKLCGMRRPEDILAVNELLPDYIGFIFLTTSHRYVTPAQAAELKQLLDPSVKAVGVFVDEPLENVAELLNNGTLDLAQLHGHEDSAYIQRLRSLTKKPLIQAFRVKTPADIERAIASEADHILLDSGMGSGEMFDWSLVASVPRPFFLAGGLDPNNVAAAIRQVAPWCVDVSSGIETDKFKDKEKMRAFVENVRAMTDRS